MIRKIPTATMSKEEWTALRATTIGGSDAAAILGLNPYKSPDGCRGRRKAAYI